MTKIIEIKSDKKSNHLRIEYMVGNYCNFKCWYCDPYANAGTHRWFDDTDLLLDNFKHLFNYYISRGKTNFELNYVGGEPSLWPNIGVFSKKIKEEFDCLITITTNGSRTLRWWDKNARTFDKIRLSCHPGQVDIDHYIDVCDLIYEKDVALNAMIMMDPINWGESISLIEKCKKSKHKWCISILEVYSNHNYTDDQKSYISKNVKRPASLLYSIRHKDFSFTKPRAVLDDGTVNKIERNFLSLNNLNRFEGWECNLGLDSINIHKDGKLSGVCGMKLYKEQFYYNIYDKDFKEKFNPDLEPVICELEKCYCQPEQLLNKRKLNDRERPLIKVYPLHKYTNP